MATNIIEIIQSNLGLPVLQKVDPNIQEAKDNNERSTGARLAQAAIPAAVAGIYRLTRTDEGCAVVQGGKDYDSWLDTVFGSSRGEVVEKVAHYANVPREEAEKQLELVSEEAVNVIRKEQSGSTADPKALRAYMSDQRHNLLVYLPAALQIGDLLNDNSMDDRTNKMEGPVSNLMHKIENAMSRGES